MTYDNHSHICHYRFDSWSFHKMNTLQIMACQVALKKMMDGGIFFISTIDDILKVTRGVPNRDDYQALRLLHCVEFKDFPQLLRLEFPNILSRVLESPSMSIIITFTPLERPPELMPPKLLASIP